MTEVDENDELTWVFDSLVGFLKGPVWNIPIMIFIEQKSVVFEPADENDEEYMKIHEEYKNLVDFMLGSHMEDLGISPEQFEKACGKATESIHTKFHQSLFEQVWAADDFEIFKRMMTQKNIELQLQALELLAHKYGLVPDSLIPTDPNGFNPIKDEEELMEVVLKRSLEEHNERQIYHKDEENSQQDVQETLNEKPRLEIERLREKDLLEKAMKLTINDTSTEDTEEAEEEPHEENEIVEQLEPAEIKAQVDPVDIKRRQEYLCQQRDRLLALKRQEREKQLNQYEQNNTEKRPRTARAAKRIVQQDENPLPDIDPKTLAFRRTLAARLKAEVIDA